LFVSKVSYDKSNYYKNDRNKHTNDNVNPTLGCCVEFNFSIDSLLLNLGLLLLLLNCYYLFLLFYQHIVINCLITLGNCKVWYKIIFTLVILYLSNNNRLETWRCDNTVRNNTLWPFVGTLSWTWRIYYNCGFNIKNRCT
jgi:hypothetical protein